ncbi:MAG: cysteine dioxygenase family protein [Bdellovibrionota bacterium]
MSLFQEQGLGLEQLEKINASLPSENLPYSRVVLVSNPQCEVMLARWAPDTPCAPHDHGTSSGWVFYLSGSFKETSYKWQNENLSADRNKTHDEKTFTQVRNSDIHSCVCVDEGLSLHIYYPGIHNMRVYDLNGRRTLTVSGNCGAWVPQNTNECLEVKSWKSQTLTAIS